MDGKSSLGMKENIAGLLCYLIPILGLIFYFIEKESKFVKFHAMQSILFCVVVIIIEIIIGILGFIFAMINLGVISMILSIVLMVAIFIGWILALINAFQGKLYKLPVIGDIADGIVNKKQ